MATPGTRSDDEGDDVDRGDRSGGSGLLPGPIRRRYAAKFLLALLLVVLVVAGVGALSYVQIQDIIEDDAEQTLRSSATMQADSISDWLASMRSQTVATASSTTLQSADRGEIETYLAEVRAVAGEDVVGLHVVDRDSERIVASTTDRYGGQSLDDRSPAWRDAIAAADGVVGSSDAAFERSGRLLMAFASDTREGDRTLVLVADVGSDVEELHRARSVVTTRVLNDEGLDVFEPRGNNPSPLIDEPEFQVALDGETRTLDRDSDVLAFAPMIGSDWVVVTEAPKSELYAASRTVGRNVLLLVGATILALSAVGALLVRRTVGPLARLRDKARAMEEGDLDVDLSTEREDEIGRLFVAFANMRDALREQIDAANAARDEAERSQRELERQNERLDEFASTVSHDLRNPLSVADGNRDLLELELADQDPDPETVQKRLDAIEDAHERLDSIIEDVLTLARGDAAVEDPEDVALATAAREAWSHVDTKGATLTVDGDGTIHADRGRLLRVFENLFRNAVEHGGPTVTVTVESTEDGFAVSDDGLGIPAEMVDTVFEHGHSGTEEGTGLGLSIVRTIANAHGWAVTVDTDYEEGARFVFTGVDDT